MQITNRAKRIGRATIAARYRSEKERKAIMSGKMDSNPNVIDAMRASQFTMNEILPALTICEIALDHNNIALLEVSAADIRKAMKDE